MASSLYWLIVLGNIREFLVIVYCFAVVITIFCSLVIFLTDDKTLGTVYEVKKMAKKCSSKGFFVCYNFNIVYYFHTIKERTDSH